MIVVVAPEPAPWVELLVRAPAALLGDAGAGVVRLFAPWRVPGWRRADAAVGAVTARRTDWQMARRFALRAAVDLLAAHALPRATRAVVAPSCGALRTFALANRRGIPAILIEDLPILRQLHADLDEAARRHPGCPLLARYRATVETLVRQEREHALADRILSRGLYAAEHHLARGRRVRPLAIPPGTGARVAGLPAPAGPAGPAAAAPVRPERHGPGPKLLLAGPPCGRSGVEEAVAAVEALDGATLLVRPSADATEPATLLRHPAVRLATPAEIHELSGVDVVVAPAPCESYPAEVTLAAARGVPVVATRQAAGAVDLAHAGAEVQPHDAAGLCEAVRRILAERRSAPSRGLC